MRISRDKANKVAHVVTDALAGTDEVDFVEDRNTIRLEVRKILEDLFVTKPAKYWLDALERVGVPAGPINDFKQVFDDEQVKVRGMEVKVKHPLRDNLSLIRNALTFSETPITEYRAPPLLGQNTNDVLKKKLGYSDAKLAELAKEKIIQQA